MASNRPGPKPKVTVSRDGSATGSVSSAPSGGRPLLIRSASSLSRRSNRPTPSAPVPGRRSSATNAACACTGAVVMPAWWRPWKATTSAPAGPATGAADGTSRRVGQRRGAERPGRSPAQHRGPAQQQPPPAQPPPRRDRIGGHQPPCPAGAPDIPDMPPEVSDMPPSPCS